MTWLLPHLDVGRALVALVISVTLYTVVQREQNPPDAGLLDVGVELANIPPGLLVLGDGPSPTVRARVSAPRDMWPGLRANALKAIVDLSRPAAGGDQFYPVTHFYPVTLDQPDPRIRVIEIIPAQISVRLDQTIELRVPVRLNRAGTVPFGYDTGEATIEHSAVAVSGPASAVRRVEAATVEVRLDGRTVNIDSRYRPVLMDPQGQVLIDSQGQPVGAEGGPVRVSPAEVRVQIPVTQQLGYKTVGLQPVLTGTPQSGHLIDGITVEPPAVTIVGSPQALAAVNFASTERIDTTDATSTFARQVSVIVPEGVSVVQDGLARVTVRLSALDLAQAIATVPLVDGLRPGLEVVSAIPSVQVTMRGAPLALHSLQGTDIRASLSLDSLGAGSHQVEVAVSTPPGIAVVAINPQMVQVTLAPASIAPIVTPAGVSSPPPQGADGGAAPP